MKYWTPVAVVVVALVVAGCGSGSPEESWTYVGTWVNSAYNGHGGGPPGKFVATTDSLAFYTNDTDTTPVTTSSFALAEDWTSGGAHYFKGTDAAGPGSRFILMRVSGNNNTLEANTSGKAYPASIDPSIGGYGIFTRQ